MFLLLSTFWKSKMLIRQHFRKQKYPFINILEYYIIDQDILKDFFHFIQFLLKLRFNEIPYSFIEAYERLLHILVAKIRAFSLLFLTAQSVKFLDSLSVTGCCIRISTGEMRHGQFFFTCLNHKGLMREYA